MCMGWGRGEGTREMPSIVISLMSQILQLGYHRFVFKCFHYILASSKAIIKKSQFLFSYIY